MMSRILDSDEETRDFNAAKAELFEAISHPLRIKILQVLNEKPMGFAELGRAVGIGSAGHLSFHLTKLRYLVKQNLEGDYALTDDGREALWSVNALEQANERIAVKVGQVSLKHRSWLRPTLGIVVVVLLVLGGVSLYQQQEYASQQQELASQQSLIAALQSGVPFVNAQNASVVIGQPNFTSEDAATSREGLYNPTQALFDTKGNLWVTDTYNNRVLEFKPPYSDGMSASVVVGQTDFVHALSGTTQTNFGQYPFGPTGAAFDQSGDLWIADSGNNRVLEFKPPFSTGMRASLVLGQSDFTARSGGEGGRNTLHVPSGLAFDSSGDLWALDSGDNRVLEYVPPFADGMNASLVIGQPSFEVIGLSTDFDGLPLLCSVNGLQCSLAIDHSNNIWLGDSENNRILEFRPPFSDGMNATMVIGAQNLMTDPWPGPGSISGAMFGFAVGFDPSGNLWTTLNHRLLVFKPPFVAEVRTFPSLEIGQPNFTATTDTGGRSGLTSPGNPGFDQLGNLWVPDGNRILEFAALSFTGVVQSSASPSTKNGQIQQAFLEASFLVLVVVIGIVFLRRKLWFNNSHQASRS